MDKQISKHGHIIRLIPFKNIFTQTSEGKIGEAVNITFKDGIWVTKLFNRLI